MYRNIVFDNIICHKCRDRYEIFYEKMGSPLYIQLSKGYLSKRIDDNMKYIWLGYFSNSIEKNKTFQYLNMLKSTLEKKCNITLETFFYDNGICIPCQNMKGKLHLEIYIRQNERIWEGTLNELPEKSFIIPIIYIENIVIKNNKWWINLKLVQVCIFPLYQKFGKCIIDMDDYNVISNPVLQNKLTNCETTMNTMSNNELVSEQYVDIKLIDHPIYGKYFKMCKLGIPKQAVAHKMVSELNDIKLISILDKDYNGYERVKLIMVEEHENYCRFFKMIKIGIPRVAVEQKMLIESLDINYLDKGKSLIPNIPIFKKNDLFMELAQKKLKKRNTNKIDEPKISIKKNGINMEELLMKRNLLFNSVKSI